LQEHSERVRGALTEGTLPTLEAYREAVGELRGYSNALKAIREAEREASGEPEAVEKKEPLYGV
jgi:hypothetical protein